MGAALASAGATAGGTPSADPPVTFSARRRPPRKDGPLRIGSLIFHRMDQIDFTGPFEVFSRMPDTVVEVLGRSRDPVTDVKGLVLTPTTTFESDATYDVLHVAGGLGQQEIMEDELTMSVLRRHASAGSLIFSVCTGALLLGAAGLLKGRSATTHWAALDLLKFYGARPVRTRVSVDGDLVTTAGVTAGIDGALLVASLLRGEDVAKEIQLDIQYAPNPVFHSGTPEQASPATMRAFYEKYGHNREARLQEARRFAGRLGVRLEGR